VLAATLENGGEAGGSRSLGAVPVEFTHGAHSAVDAALVVCQCAVGGGGG
jgi:hypothetical protein